MVVSLSSSRITYLEVDASVAFHSWIVPLASVTITWLPASGVKSAANTVESNPLNVLTRFLDEMSHK